MYNVYIYKQKFTDRKDYKKNTKLWTTLIMAGGGGGVSPSSS